MAAAVAKTRAAREGVPPRGYLGGALLALQVLLGQVHALETLLRLRLRLQLLLLPLVLAVALVADNGTTVLSGRLRIGADAARQVVQYLLLEGEARVHVRHPRALSRGVRLP